MKKLLITFMLACTMQAMADDFNYLTVCYNNIEKSITLETIQKITFENGNAVIATSNGDESFPLTQLEKMYFAETATRIEKVATEEQSNRKEIYDLCGRRLPNAPLHKGLYIINGKKVIIK